MRFLLVVACCIALAQADNLGYNYQPVAHSAPAPAASYAAPSYSAPSYAAPSYSAPSYAAPAPSYVAPAPAASAPAQTYSAPAGVDKEFYSFAANDQDFLEPAGSNQAQSLLNERLQVVFVKGPEQNGLEDAAIALAKQASQQKTAIYVLNKQADLSDLAGRLKNLGSHGQQQPEVHFVKYRTPEDAANAQQAIQSQYDQLGGDSHSHNGGAASTINFASAPAPVHQAAPSAPGASYLPSSIIKRVRV